MSIKELYQELIIDHGSNPRNFKAIENANAIAESYNPVCGDKIILFLEIKDNKIVDVGFQGYGCAISTASASIMTELLIGKTIEQANSYFEHFTQVMTSTDSSAEKPLPTEKLEALTGVKNYPSRIKCATLAWHTLKHAINNQNKKT
jgi:nitrogen fixation NifU-like protein